MPGYLFLVEFFTRSPINSETRRSAFLCRRSAVYFDQINAYRHIIANNQAADMVHLFWKRYFTN